jgi:hypothetical protein
VEWFAGKPRVKVCGADDTHTHTNPVWRLVRRNKRSKRVLWFLDMSHDRLFDWNLIKVIYHVLRCKKATAVEWQDVVDCFRWVLCALQQWRGDWGCECLRCWERDALMKYLWILEYFHFK